MLKENEYLRPEDGYGEKGYDISYSFRLSGGAVLSMRYYSTQVTMTDAQLCAMDAEGERATGGYHTVSIGYGREEYCLLDGKPMPAGGLCREAGKEVYLHNAGTGEIYLSDLLVEFPQWRDPRPPGICTAPRTWEELLDRTKIWARYLIYPQAPPPLRIR